MSEDHYTGSRIILPARLKWYERPWYWLRRKIGKPLPPKTQKVTVIGYDSATKTATFDRKVD